MEKPRSASRREVGERWSQARDGAQTRRGGAAGGGVFTKVGGKYAHAHEDTQHTQTGGVSPGDLSMWFSHMTSCSEISPEQADALMWTSDCANGLQTSLSKTYESI